MFSIQEILRLFQVAERINSSRNLTDEEKLALLEALCESIPTGIAGLPEAASIVLSSIQRMTKNERANIAKRNAAHEEQGRETEGQQEPTEVAPSGVEEGQAPEGTTEGLEEQAEDASGTDAPSNGAKTRRKRKAPEA